MNQLNRNQLNRKRVSCPCPPITFWKYQCSIHLERTSNVKYFVPAKSLRAKVSFGRNSTRASSADIETESWIDSNSYKLRPSNSNLVLTYGDLHTPKNCKSIKNNDDALSWISNWIYLFEYIYTVHIIILKSLWMILWNEPCLRWKVICTRLASEKSIWLWNK